MKQKHDKDLSGSDQMMSNYFCPTCTRQLFDMLRDGGRDNPLIIHEDDNHDIYVQGLSEFMVKTMEECLALLNIGKF